MSQAKRTSRGKRPSKAVSVLGIAGMSLAASTSGSPADIPPASFGGPTVGSVADMLWQSTAPFQIPALDDEEISDVSLATFHLFDNENPGNSGSGIQLAVRSGCGGCGCGHGGGCGGARGCGGAEAAAAPEAAVSEAAAWEAAEAAAWAAAAAAAAGGWGGCGGCGWGWGWGGCCLSWGGCGLC